MRKSKRDSQERLKQRAARTQKLLAVIDHYLRITKASVSHFGRASMNDPNFVTGLRRGRTVSQKTTHRVVTYMHGVLVELDT